MTMSLPSQSTPTLPTSFVNAVSALKDVARARVMRGRIFFKLVSRVAPPQGKPAEAIEEVARADGSGSAGMKNRPCFQGRSLDERSRSERLVGTAEAGLGGFLVAIVVGDGELFAA